MTTKPQNPYLGDAFERAQYKRKREEWERRGRKGPPPTPPKNLKNKLLR